MTRGPGRIRKLDAATVNRIAAGEVIHRPAHALKELLENSLDSGARSIAILALGGGLQLLQVTDTGSGIIKEDLQLVCERFTTSKLQSFEDLLRGVVQTFGFRGEALASMTHVARVSIRSKTAESPVAWTGEYSDGALIGPVKPIAGVTGTQVSVQDLFYNVPARKSVLKNLTAEYNRILDVVQVYAIQNPSVAISCRKGNNGNKGCDLSTPGGSSSRDVIRLIYGGVLAKELVDMDQTCSDLEFSVKGHLSNANYNRKKFTFILFINDRAVEHVLLRKGIEAVYQPFLPKGTHPFVYLSLTIKPEHLDVNVHPTKQIVQFLNADAIVERICSLVQESLAAHNVSRTFYTQTLLPHAAPVNPVTLVTEPKVIPSSQKVRAPEHKLVRTDSRMLTLDHFMKPITAEPVAVGSVSSVTNVIDDEFEEFAADDVSPEDLIALDQGDVQRDSCASNDVETLPDNQGITKVRLTSVLSLRQALEDNEHSGITSLFQEHIFVGVVDEQRALIQYQTKLLMVNFVKLSELLMYQILIYGFANFSRMSLSPAPKLSDLLNLTDTSATVSEKERNKIVNLLVDRTDMLSEYYSIDIDTESRTLVSLPVLINGYTPNLRNLPRLVLDLGRNVNWTSEKECFQSLSLQLARFYSWNSPEEKADTETYNRSVEHTLFPTLKTHFIGQSQLADNGHVVELANLPDLYKVFERC